jgi:hypothetical protein
MCTHVSCGARQRRRRNEKRVATRLSCRGSRWWAATALHLYAVQRQRQRQRVARHELRRVRVPIMEVARCFDLARAGESRGGAGGGGHDDGSEARVAVVSAQVGFADAGRLATVGGARTPSGWVETGQSAEADHSGSRGGAVRQKQGGQGRVRTGERTPNERSRSDPKSKRPTGKGARRKSLRTFTHAPVTAVPGARQGVVRVLLLHSTGQRLLAAPR